jgi:hypothetical protein
VTRHDPQLLRSWGRPTSRTQPGGTALTNFEQPLLKFLSQL